MIFDWKKTEKAYYQPKATPELITIPKFKFFTLEGSGDPNGEAFSDEIGVLYSLAYGIKMLPKKGTTPEGYVEYSVFPLEGIWDISESEKQKVRATGSNQPLDKSQLEYKIMIRQPDFVTEELAAETIKSVMKKKPNPLLDKVRFEEIEDGMSVQMLHLGSYDDELKSFDLMKKFCEEQGLERRLLNHREIYLSDARRTETEKLRTVLRYFVG